MRFLQKNDVEKTILVISDLHLGAGGFVEGRRNFLEDFHHDEELVEFLEFYSTGQFSSQEVELVINGDFFDFLAVPYVKFFDDEYWSEKAALEKLRLIMNAHKEVIEALNKFLEVKNKSITFIIGNHDGELVFPSVRKLFINSLSDDAKENFEFRESEGEYLPYEGVLIKHGHEYERAHCFDLNDSTITSAHGQDYFVPPWGSYYVTRVINRFKEERGFINQIRPIKTFLLHGLIFDTLFTLRFMFANAFYFIMVRFLYIFKQGGKLKHVFDSALEELELFHDLETMTKEFFYRRPEIQALIVGHTHEANYKVYNDGKVFINTGTWTNMYNLDFAKKQDGYKLTYAQIDVLKEKSKTQKKVTRRKKTRENLNIALNIWTGKNHLPYQEF